MAAKKSKSTSFRNRIAHAGFWTIGGHGFSQALRLGSNLIMTRLLVPEMFGIMAIANLLMVGLALFSDIGLNQNIIQSKQGDDPEFLNTAWAIQILRGLCLWILALLVSFAFFFAPNFGWLGGDSVYANPILPFILAAISFNAAISGFNSTKLATSMRRLDQKSIALIEFFSQTIALTTMFVWVYIDRSIWALVIASIAGSMTKMILSHTLLPGLSNHWQWNPIVAKEVIRFGKWIFLSSIIGFLLNNGDRLLLGGLVTPGQLGVYSIAFLLVNSLQTAVSKLTSSVIFPALSEVARERRHQLKNTYYKFRVWIDIVLLFMSGFFFITGEIIINILYDERYSQAGTFFQILSLIMIAQRYALADQCYLAMGKPKLLSALISIRTFALFILLPAGFHLFGMKGAVWGITLSAFVTIPPSLYLKNKYAILDIKKELIILPVFLIGLSLGKLVVQITG